ncbi:MAG TPA: hypothetical protein DCG28_04880 [Lachnospiraceae bacterium]|nr:hypothetical protein [Lachnospiraceae bacterium]
MAMEQSKFEKMYQTVINNEYGNDDEIKEHLMNWGGKGKLQKTLFDSEVMQVIVPAMNASNGMATFVSDEVVILTDKRFLFLEDKLLGTLVTEVPLKEASRGLRWEGEKKLQILNNKKTQVYFGDEAIDLIKEKLYDYM